MFNQRLAHSEPMLLLLLITLSIGCNSSKGYNHHITTVLWWIMKNNSPTWKAWPLPVTSRGSVAMPSINCSWYPHDSPHVHHTIREIAIVIPLLMFITHLYQLVICKLYLYIIYPLKRNLMNILISQVWSFLMDIVCMEEMQHSSSRCNSGASVRSKPRATAEVRDGINSSQSNMGSHIRLFCVIIINTNNN